MTRIRETRSAVLLVPEFDYFPGLCLPDPERAFRAAVLSVTTARRRAAGEPLLFDPGASGCTAAELAGDLAAAGVSRATVGGTVAERIGAGILFEALQEAGIDCKPPLLALDERRTFSEVAEAMLGHDDPSGGKGGRIRQVDGPEGGGREKRQSTGEDRAAVFRDAESSAFYIVEAEGIIPDAGIVFRRDGRRLVRVSPGGSAAVPRWVEEIHLVDPARFSSSHGKAAESGAGCTTLLAAAIPAVEHADDADAVEAWREGCGRMINEAGAQRFRLVPRRPTAGDGSGTGSVAWARRWGLERTVMRRALVDLATDHLPGRLAQVLAAVGFYRQGVDPLEEMYAGNSLADRNAELLVNIV